MLQPVSSGSGNINVLCFDAFIASWMWKCSYIIPKRKYELTRFSKILMKNLQNDKYHTILAHQFVATNSSEPQRETEV